MSHTADNKPWRDEDRLRELYLNQGLSQEELASEFDCSATTVYRWLSKFEIEKRREEHPWRDEQALRELYVDDGLTTYEIADEFNCAHSTIVRWTNRHGIERDKGERPWRDKDTLYELYVEKDLTQAEIGEKLNVNRSTIREWLHRHDIPVDNPGGWESGPWRDKDVLKRLYVEQEKSVTEIADELGCSHATITKWLAKNGIRTRTPDHVSNQFFEEDSIEEETPPEKNPALLRQLYLGDDMSAPQIARKLGVSDRLIRVHLDKHGVLDEKDNESPTIGEIDFDIPSDSPWQNTDLMLHLYVNRDLSTTQIGNLLDCSTATVSTWLNRHDIETSDREYERPSQLELRRMYIDKNMSTLDISNKMNISLATIRSWLLEAGIEIKPGEDYLPEELFDEEALRELYCTKGYTLRKISEELGCSLNAVVKYFRKHGIERRDRSEALRGENNPWWTGSRQPYGQGWNEKKKRQVYERDDYTCQSCGVSQEDHIKNWGQRLEIHHIIPARKFEDAEKRNALSNLVSLCKECHKKWEGVPVKPTFVSD
jgi:transposase